MAASSSGSAGASGRWWRRHCALDLPYACWCLLGAGTLFPWNSLITAADYWEARYPGKHTDRLLTISYLPVNLVVIALMVRWHGRVRPQLRILGGLVGFTLAISAVPLLDLAEPTNATLAAVLLLVAACGVCDGFAQGALFGEAALLPPRYTQALVSGTAVSGVVVSLLRCVTKATLPDTEEGLRRSANLYFTMAALVCAACCVVYSFVLPRLPVVQQYKLAALEAALQAEGGEPAGGGAGADGSSPGKLPLEQQQQQERQRLQQQRYQQQQRPSLDLELSYEDQHHHPHQPQQHYEQPEDGGSQALAQQHKLEQSPAQALLPGDQRLSSSNGSGRLFGDHRARQYAQDQRAQAGGVGSDSSDSAGFSSTAVFRMIWQCAVANMLIYMVTLSIFPGVLAEDVHSAELGSWYPVSLITAFNVADWVGKSLPGLAALRLRNDRAILASSIARAVFVPAFHLAAVGGAGPGVIGLLTTLLGLSNGYCTAVAMMLGPEVVPPAAAELAGNIMVLFLILGLCIGAACGFLWLL